ncbi:MAG: DMT family transporter [Sinobacteraceae bacterium]|nr:DMT family transporter [Nevskiaceae bacterium]
MSTSTRSELRAYAMLALVMLFWSGNAIVGRAVRDDIPPITLAFVRWLGAFLVVVGPAAHHLVADWSTLLRHWKATLFLGLTGVASFNTLFYIGLIDTTATNALLLQAATPALVLMLDAAVFGIHAAAAQIVGVLLSILGVGFVLFPDLGALLGLHFGRGDVFILTAVVVWAVYTSFLRRRPPVHPLSFLTATFATAVVVLLPLAALEWREAAAIDWHRPQILGAFLYVAVLPSVAAYFLFNAAVAAVGAAKAGQSITLMPVFGALLAALLLGEPLLPSHFVGMALILAGIGVSILLGRR